MTATAARHHKHKSVPNPEIQTKWGNGHSNKLEPRVFYWLNIISKYWLGIRSSSKCPMNIQKTWWEFQNLQQTPKLPCIFDGSGWAAPPGCWRPRAPPFIFNCFHVSLLNTFVICHLFSVSFVIFEKYEWQGQIHSVEETNLIPKLLKLDLTNEIDPKPEFLKPNATAMKRRQ